MLLVPGRADGAIIDAGDRVMGCERARAVPGATVTLIPEAGHLRANVGTFDDGDREVSHPLALTQLLIAYHMVKAAAGRHGS